MYGVEDIIAKAQYKFARYWMAGHKVNTQFLTAPEIISIDSGILSLSFLKSTCLVPFSVARLSGLAAQLFETNF